MLEDQSWWQGGFTLVNYRKTLLGTRKNNHLFDGERVCTLDGAGTGKVAKKQCHSYLRDIVDIADRTVAGGPSHSEKSSRQVFQSFLFRVLCAKFHFSIVIPKYVVLRFYWVVVLYRLYAPFYGVLGTLCSASCFQRCDGFNWNFLIQKARFVSCKWLASMVYRRSSCPCFCYLISLSCCCLFVCFLW